MSTSTRVNLRSLALLFLAIVCIAMNLVIMAYRHEYNLIAMVIPMLMGVYAILHLREEISHSKKSKKTTKKTIDLTKV